MKYTISLLLSAILFTGCSNTSAKYEMSFKKAIEEFRVDIVKQYIQDSVDVNQNWADMQIPPLYTAVIMACDEEWRIEIVKLLIENGADVSWKVEDGESLLHLAAMLGSTEVVRILVENGADRLAEYSGKIPLYWANNDNNEEMGRLLAVPGKRYTRKKENELFFEKYLREELSSMRKVSIKSDVKTGEQTPEQALKEFNEEVWFLSLNGKNIDPELMEKMKVLNKKFKPFLETAYNEDENVIDKETGELASLFSLTTEWTDDNNVKMFVQLYNSPLGGFGFTYKARYFHGRWFSEYLNGMVY